MLNTANERHVMHTTAIVEKSKKKTKKEKVKIERFTGLELQTPDVETSTNLLLTALKIMEASLDK
jgi:hypothetical protein